jgi:hypothetical protein
MNRLLIDQLARHISNEKYSTKTYYMSDIDQSAAAINFFVLYLDQKLRTLCYNAKDTGICDLTWKHLDCRVLMEILFELTEDEKFKVSDWYV